MSVHNDCGENIHWFPRSDDPSRYLPPMEFAGQVMVIIDGKMTETTAYRYHRCDPDKVVAWQEYIATMTELKGPESHEAKINMRVAASERNREDLYKFAMQVDCAQCEAYVGQPCRNLSVLKKTGEVQETRYPHPKRVEDAGRVDRMNREEDHDND